MGFLGQNPKKSASPKSAGRNARGYGRLQTLLQPQSEIPLMTVSKERVKGDDLTPAQGPADDNRRRKQSLVTVCLPGAGERGSLQIRR